MSNSISYTNYGITLTDVEVRNRTGIDLNAELNNEGIEGRVKFALAFYVDNMMLYILSFHFNRIRVNRIISENVDVIVSAICDQISYCKNAGDLVSLSGANIPENSVMEIEKVQRWYICDTAKRRLLISGVLRGR